MSEVVPMLHKKFSQLIAGEAQTFWCTKAGWKPKSIKVDRASKMHAAFFIEEVMLYPRKAAPSDLLLSDLKLPFDSFWIGWHCEEQGQSVSEFAHFERSHQALVLSIFGHTELRTGWSGTNYVFETDTSLVAQLYPVHRLGIGRAFELLDIVNAPVEQVEEQPHYLIRQRFAKGGVNRKETRFITVRPNRFVSQSHGRNGTSKTPHNRRGHWRNYRSGKKVWIADCAIHGGSKAARDYAILN